MELKISNFHTITTEQLADLMVAAFEGGINYWCGKVTIIEPEKWGNKLASDIVAEGGDLILYDAESTDKWELTHKKLLNAIPKVLDWGGFSDVEEMCENHDAETADVLIQFAVFDEITFG